MVLLVFHYLGLLPGRLVHVQPVLEDVLDDAGGEEVEHAHSALKEEADLGGGDVVLYQLPDNVDVVAPLAQAVQRRVDLGARALDDEGAVAAEDVVELITKRYLAPGRFT